MPSSKIREAFQKKFGLYQEKFERKDARLGRGDKTVAVPGKVNMSYVTYLGTNVVEEVLNYRVDTSKYGQLVSVGYHPTEFPTRKQILGPSDKYVDAGQLDVPAHDHTWRVGSNMTAWIRTLQILDGLVIPVAGSRMVDIWPANYILVSGWKQYRETTRLDVSAAFPVSWGICAALVVVDGLTGNFELRVGPTVPNINILQTTDFPVPDPGDSVQAALLCDYAYSELDYDHILDLRFSNINGISAPSDSIVPSSIHFSATNKVLARLSASAGVGEEVDLGDLTVTSPVGISDTHKLVGGSAVLKLVASIANRILYSTGVDTWAETAVTALGRTLLALSPGLEGQFLRYDGAWDTPGSGGGGAPAAATYITTSDSGGLTNEVVIPGLAAHPDKAGVGGTTWSEEFDTITDPFTWTSNPSVFDSNTTFKSHYYAKMLNSATRIYGLKSYAPGAGVAFDARCKVSIGMSDGTTSTKNIYFMVSDAAISNVCALMLAQGTSGFSELFRAVAVTNSTNQATVITRQSVMYFRIMRDASNIYRFYLSNDGLLWTCIYTSAALAFTVEKIGFAMVTNATAGQYIELAVDWLRVS